MFHHRFLHLFHFRPLHYGATKKLGANQLSVDHKQNEIPAMRAFFTFPPTRSTDGHGGSTITLEVRAISARSNDEFPPKQERRITTFNQSYHLQIAVSTPYS